MSDVRHICVRPRFKQTPAPRTALEVQFGEGLPMRDRAVAEKALELRLVATSGQTPAALMNGKQLVNLLLEHEILMRKTPHVLLDLSEDAGLVE